jgi:hypothetical protein
MITKNLEDFRRELLAATSLLRAVITRQAEDEGLWFDAETAPEAYLQQELRALHQCVEDTYAVIARADELLPQLVPEPVPEPVPV